MLDPITSTIITKAATAALSNVIDDLYSFLRSKAKYTINKRNVTRKLPTLFSRMQNVRFIKTLWQFDTAVDVESFYCDSHVITPQTKGRKGRRRTIDKVSDFGEVGNILIKGIAGQGKSIFLRHLCITEFQSGERIPVFIELRRILKYETIFDHISRYLDILDLPIDVNLFRVLLQSGKFVFFLDGFDEIPEEHKQRTLNELENLSAYSGNSPFIITTRPNTSIEMSPSFDVFTLDDLKGREYKTVINKLAGSRSYANTLIRAISANKDEVLQLLSTPLLITLLIISYKSYQKLPEKLSDFYDSIFFVLLRRHDGTKPGFTRPRRCRINDNQYREIFDTLCFEANKSDKPFFDYRVMCELVEKSIGRMNLIEDADCYLKDIIDVTCLILHEGNEYRFIHKSVQEYYAASFIKNRPENLAKDFYAACKSDYFTSAKWEQELGFLSQIDKYRYSKYYLLPLCRKWLNVDNDNDLINGCPSTTKELIKHTVGLFIIGLGSGSPDCVHSFQLNTLGQILDEVNYLDLMDLDFCDLLSRIKERSISVDKELLKRNYLESRIKAPRTENNESTFIIVDITVEQIKDEGYYVNEITSLATRIIDDIYSIWRQAYSYVDREDSFDITADIGI